MATAREVVAGSASLSTIRTAMPSRASHTARANPVGPAPTIRTVASARPVMLELLQGPGANPQSGWQTRPEPPRARDLLDLCTRLPRARQLPDRRQVRDGARAWHPTC